MISVNLCKVTAHFSDALADKLHHLTAAKNFGKKTPLIHLCLQHLLFISLKKDATSKDL